MTLVTTYIRYIKATLLYNIDITLKFEIRKKTHKISDRSQQTWRMFERYIHIKWLCHSYYFIQTSNAEWWKSQRALYDLGSRWRKMINANLFYACICYVCTYQCDLYTRKHRRALDKPYEMYYVCFVPWQRRWKSTCNATIYSVLSWLLLSSLSFTVSRFELSLLFSIKQNKRVRMHAFHNTNMSNNEALLM